jgi:hypothetical protein
VVRDNIPSTYNDERDWGQTRPRVSGLDVRLDGWQLRTKRRRKDVRHGTWKRYQITQLDPDTNLQVRIGRVRTLPDGRAAFRIALLSKVNAVARVSQWNRGVRIASISVDADADVRLIIGCRLDVRLDLSRFPPDIVLLPEVMDADLHITDFRVNRISHFDGPVARQLGEALEKILSQKIEEQRPRLVTRINQQITKHQDDLRISLHDTLREKWEAFAGSPPDLDAAPSTDPSPPPADDPQPRRYNAIGDPARAFCH